MKKLCQALLEELKQGRGAMLCSIVSSDGSTPRGAGAKMLVRRDGTTLGTIGGGAVEFQSTALAMDALKEGKTVLHAYRLSPNQTADIGMICGGDVQVAFQYFDPAVPAQAELVERVMDYLDRQDGAWLVMEFTDAGWRGGTWTEKEGLVGLEVPEDELKPILGQRGILSKGDPTRYAEPIGKAGIVYLFGAGHVGRALVPVLTAADFRVVVYDQRPHAVAPGELPDAAACYCGSYEEALEKLPPIGREDFAVVMTPGHMADYAILRQLLRTEARYIGCIGSRRKVAATREKLRNEGFTDADIARITAPIGLDIGGETPGEIAVSVAAQIIAVRSGRIGNFQK